MSKKAGKLKRVMHSSFGKHLVPKRNVGNRLGKQPKNSKGPRPWHAQELPCSLCGALTANNFAPSHFKGWMCMGCALEIM